MLTNQNKVFFIILTDQNKVCASKYCKVQKIPVKECFKDSCKDSNIQLINKKFGSNIDDHMKKHY